MLSVVYKSLIKAETYLFVERRDDFARVPAPLLQTFGTPKLTMIINLATKTHLGQADLSKVRAALISQGYYLQLPPPPEDLLKQFKEQQAQSRE
ncbi:YcgL domain-containing protein [Oceanisphaera sp. IT1-181]|uniref:YcgL domain-containing protein n=1 Tax=Oceanisphaera sp. IT1-181 TaxID=3081199 RepID=UPI0029C9D943|nr:YcgL domain-containing protein [Oceanisphaera sp. IT1-181]